MKKEIITIAGGIGSGKSSTADNVARVLGFGRFSSGDFMRQAAVDLGMTLNELSIQAETDKSVDEKIDEQVRKAGEMTRVVIDSRLAFHWIPESFKIYLDLPPEISKSRILNNLKENKLRRESEESLTEEEIFQKITRRLESEKKRYKEMYNLDHTDKNNFDLVIDTDKNNLNQVVNIIVEAYKKWLEQ
ncbi:MAG: cytidylate kinase family protein [Candidatus Nomurabacteria bacterium]|nr:cytidylate kinase family protein [Candidatus Nomurabacteria bacterium]